jgi:uncharacterized protein (DUF433 family)
VARASGIYGGKDPAAVPAYSIPEAARFIRVPQATVRSWVLGRTYPSRTGPRSFDAVIDAADPARRSLSFLNLVELHVLSAIRRDHGVKFDAVRKAVQFLRRRLTSRHPLADVQMLTDGKHLFVERYRELVNVSDQGQLEMQALLGNYLKRIDRDPRGVAIRLYPFTVTNDDTDPRTIVIDPRVQFGRPCLVGSGMPTALIAERHQAGDSIREIANDYGLEADAIEEAIRYESRAA